MNSLFRPRILFKNFYVDLSIFAVCGVAVTLIIFLHLSIESISLPFMLIGAVLGFFIGIFVIIWEIFWHNHKQMKSFFHPSYLPHSINALFILSMSLLSNGNFISSTLTGFLGYQLTLLVGLIIFEQKSNKRYKWIELFP